MSDSILCDSHAAVVAAVAAAPSSAAVVFGDSSVAVGVLDDSESWPLSSAAARAAVVAQSARFWGVA